MVVVVCERLLAVVSVNGCQGNFHAEYQLGYFCVFTALVLAELILASLVDHFPKTEALKHDEVSYKMCGHSGSSQLVGLIWPLCRISCCINRANGFGPFYKLSTLLWLTGACLTFVIKLYFFSTVLSDWLGITSL